jgi:hypothetical protein
LKNNPPEVEKDEVSDYLCFLFSTGKSARFDKKGKAGRYEKGIFLCIIRK